MKRIPVAVRSDDVVIHAGMTALLRQHPEIELLTDASLAAVHVVCPDVVDDASLADLHQMAAGGTARVVLVVGTIKEAHLLGAIECGVVSVVRRREVSAAGLLRAIKGAQNGGGQLPSDLLGGLLVQVGQARREQARRGVVVGPGLSAREIDVIRLLAEGFETREIALKLSYSERTVKSVLYVLSQRLQLRNRAHAVAYAARHGYL